jgi:hypothetical protein
MVNIGVLDTEVGETCGVGEAQKHQNRSRMEWWGGMSYSGPADRNCMRRSASDGDRTGRVERGLGGRNGSRRRWRNEPNLGHGRLGLYELRGGEGRGFRGGLGIARGHQAFEFMEGAFVRSLAGVDVALEAFEVSASAGVGAAMGVVLIRETGGLEFFAPELSVDSGEAAELPVVADEDIDVKALFGRDGLETIEIFPGEGFEFLARFPEDDFRFGVDAGFQGVHRRGGLADDGARAGGFLGIEAVGLDLMDGGHVD